MYHFKFVMLYRALAIVALNSAKMARENMAWASTEDESLDNAAYWMVKFYLGIAR